MNRFGHTNCIECHRPHEREHNAWRCWSCLRVFLKVKARAINTVAHAVLRGEIAPAKALSCVDCGAPATDYDHRDYRAPLVVEPCCRSCNLKRGPAAWRAVSHSEPAVPQQQDAA